MYTSITTLLPHVRNRLIEPTPNFWTDAELTQIMITGIKDMWRDIVDLKQGHFLVLDVTNVSMPSNSFQLTGVPANVHKIFNIEPRDITANSSDVGLRFQPLPYTDDLFQFARSLDAIQPQNDVIYYTLRGQGSPVGPPIVDVAPKVSSTVPLAFSYVPTLEDMTQDSQIPIPAESDNALIAWTVAYARAKERDDRMPDPAWLSIYATEKAHILQSLGIRQYQELPTVKAKFEDYW